MISFYQKEVKMNFMNKPKKLSSFSIDNLREANKAYLEKDQESVIYFSMEVLKKEPDCEDAFNLLTLVYEEMGEMKKAADFQFIKLQMKKSGKTESNEWGVVGHKYLYLKDYKSAGYCFQRALKLNPNHSEYLLQRANCHEFMDNEKSMIFFYERYLKEVNYSDEKIVSKLIHYFKVQSNCNNLVR